MYVPARQFVHGPALGPVDPALQTQAKMAILPSIEVECNGQSSHAELPADDLYMPGAHIGHGLPLGPVDPALQVHEVRAALSMGEVERNGQSTQYELPDLYLPDAHIVHEPPLGPVDPGLQVHCVLTVLSAGEMEFGGQAVQASDVPYDPARQLHGIIELIHQFALQPVIVPVASEVNITSRKRCVVVVE